MVLFVRVRIDAWKTRRQNSGIGNNQYLSSEARSTHRPTFVFCVVFFLLHLLHTVFL